MGTERVNSWATTSASPKADRISDFGFTLNLFKARLKSAVFLEEMAEISAVFVITDQSLGAKTIFF
jgi:hypothetical protein